MHIRVFREIGFRSYEFINHISPNRSRISFIMRYTLRYILIPAIYETIIGIDRRLDMYFYISSGERGSRSQNICRQ